MMKIYTKKGDKGYTSLFGGKSIKKNSVRIHAYGTVDELNSVLGMVLTHPLSENGKSKLAKVQEQLFVLGADLATLPSKKEKIERIGPDDIDWVEKGIDELEKNLPKLTSFILPGGSPAGASLHLARTVCRRAERYTAELRMEGSVSDETVIYLNRLSDFFFVLARYENYYSGAEETKWLPRK
jgi:cob(I)alamin adenosyltransferase